MAERSETSEPLKKGAPLYGPLSADILHHPRCGLRTHPFRALSVQSSHEGQPVFCLVRAFLCRTHTKK